MKKQNTSLRGAKRRSNLYAQRLFAMTVLLIVCFSAYAFAEEKFFEIKAKKFVYTPNIIKVKKGDLVRIRLVSEDVTHGMFFDGYGINTSAHPGQEGSLKFVADKAGRFSFRCSVTCGEFHPYMIGYLVVEKNFRYFGYVFLTVFIGLITALAIIFKKPKQPAPDQAQQADESIRHEEQDGQG